MVVCLRVYCDRRLENTGILLSLCRFRVLVFEWIGSTRSVLQEALKMSFVSNGVAVLYHMSASHYKWTVDVCLGGTDSANHTSAPSVFIDED